jgi:hypothetical protein
MIFVKNDISFDGNHNNRIKRMRLHQHLKRSLNALMIAAEQSSGDGVNRTGGFYLQWIVFSNVGTPRALLLGCDLIHRLREAKALQQR